MNNKRCEGNTEETVQVADNLKGRVIGKEGHRIKQIKQTSGAFVTVCAEGFLVRGYEAQRECAKKLIQDTVNPFQRSMAPDGNDDHDVEDQEIVLFDEDLKGQAIGKGGCNVKMIMKKSGAVIETCDDGFLVRGSKEQIGSAKNQLLEIVKELSPKLVKIPEEYKGAVIGKAGQTLNKISTRTGARLFREEGEVYIRGSEEAKQRALLQIKRIVSQARMSRMLDQKMRVCCFVDNFSLPEKSYLSLTPVESMSPTHGGYRLQLHKDYEKDKTVDGEISRYLDNLKENVVRCLLEIREHIDSGKQQRNDMWCHFGTVVIENVDEGDACNGEEAWTLDEVSNNLVLPLSDIEENSGKPLWHTKFKEGVTFDEKLYLGDVLNKPVYDTRHDLSFLTPSGRPVRCKVWVREKDREEDDAEIPFGDVKNVLEEVHFRNERTSARCKGWLCLPSVKRLKADIAFPACNFDCRLTIRTTGDEFAKERIAADREEDLLLLDYLSNLTLLDDEVDELPPPKNKIPADFYLDYRRCCRRSVFSYGKFTIIVSKETSFLSETKDGINKEKKTDLHLHCNKWDELLRTGKWEPQDIVEMLPEFLGFVKTVHSMVLGQENHLSAEYDDK